MSQQEMTLEEWMNELPDFHLANKQLSDLKGDFNSILKRLDTASKFLERDYPAEAGSINKQVNEMIKKYNINTGVKWKG